MQTQIKMFPTSPVLFCNRLGDHPTIFLSFRVMVRGSGSEWSASCKPWWYSVVPLKRGQFSPKSSQWTLHSSPVRARYGVFFVNLKSDTYSELVNAVVCKISCYSGAGYNGTQLCSDCKQWLIRWGPFQCKEIPITKIRVVTPSYL